MVKRELISSKCFRPTTISNYALNMTITTQNSQYPPQNNSQNYTPQTNNSQQQPSVSSSNYYSTVAPYYTSPRLSPVSSRKTSLESAPPVLCQTPTIVLSSVGCREETTTPPNKQAQPGTGAGSVWKGNLR